MSSRSLPEPLQPDVLRAGVGSLRPALLLAAGMLAVAGVAAACSSDPGTTAESSPASADRTALVEIYAAPGCECCGGWEEYMKSHGFEVVSTEEADLAQFKAERRIPLEAQSCHTAVIDGYTVEGHVPVEAIDDLLADRPDIDGIALPGMPPGSPGMSGEKTAPFEVLAIDDGSVSPFGEY